MARRSRRKPRTFRLTSPHMRGSDIKAFQVVLNRRAAARGLGRVKLDAEYGKETRELARRVCYYMGIPSPLEHGVTPRHRVLLRHPKRRNRVQEQRARRRMKVLRRRQRRRRQGPNVACAWARKRVGITERPPGSNRGPTIDVWQRNFGIIGAPWCGAFVGSALRAAGVDVSRRIVYVPYIVSDAASGVNGLKSWHRSGTIHKGDLVVLFGSSHVEIAIQTGKPGEVLTIGGNTSPGNSGSQANGGGVFIRKRSASQITGWARPRYS